jgi:serine/threonine-protein kinase
VLGLCRIRAVNDGPTLPEPRGTLGAPATPPEPQGEVLTRASTLPFAAAQPTPADDLLGSPDLPVGTLVGKYRIIQAIRGGGMGYVYRAHNPDLKREVALKMIRSAELTGPDAVRRFKLECESLARFRHPNIVAVHDASQHRGRPYLVMEYLPGGSLSDHLKEYQGDVRAAVALMEKVARAVAHLHAEEMLHRDLKPANVLLDDAGEPRVSDFGLVKLLESNDTLTHTSQRPGTPPYMAPEQTEFAAAPLSPATDVWALGVMLYELLLGRRPFLVEDRTCLFHQIATADPDRPRKLRPGLQAELEAVVLKCLEKDPARRFRDAGELAEELERWLGGLPTKTRPDGRIQAVGRFLKRYPWAIAIAVLALLGLAGGAVAVTILDREAPIVGDLRAGKAVELLPDRGEPSFSEALLGTPVTSRTSDGYYSVEAWDPLLLALVSKPPCDQYRLRAWVRHYKGDNVGDVGVFVGYRQSPSPYGLVHRCQVLRFSDLGNRDSGADGKVPADQLAQRPASLDSWVSADIGKPRPRRMSTGNGQLRFDISPHGGKWRRLEIVVRAGNLQATFDGDALKPVALIGLQKSLRVLLENQAQRDPIREGFLATVDPAFDARGAIGLYIAASRAAFSDVVIEPLSPP